MTGFLQGYINQYNQHGDSGLAFRFFHQTSTQNELVEYIKKLINPNK
jgi:hypothetical protein